MSFVFVWRTTSTLLLFQHPVWAVLSEGTGESLSLLSREQYIQVCSLEGCRVEAGWGRQGVWAKLNAGVGWEACSHSPEEKA